LYNDSKKKAEKKEEATEKRYNPAEGTIPAGTDMGK